MALCMPLTCGTYIFLPRILVIYICIYQNTVRVLRVASKFQCSGLNLVVLQFLYSGECGFGVRPI